MFCSSASDVQSCLTQIHSKHHCQILSSPLPAPPTFHYRNLPLISGRRLSRSEGDLRCWPSESPLSILHLRSHSISRASTSSEDEISSPKVSKLGLLMQFLKFHKILNFHYSYLPISQLASQSI